MNTKKHHWIFYLIGLTIIVTITVQFYWNYNNYQNNKTRISNEIQISLDNAVEEYYSTLSKKSFFAIIGASNIRIDSTRTNITFGADSLKKKFKINSLEIRTDKKNELNKLPTLLDSMMHGDLNLKNTFNRYHQHYDSLAANKTIKVITGKKAIDSLNLIKGLQSAYIALENDTLDLRHLDSLFKKQLKNNNIQSLHYFEFFKQDSLFHRSSFEHNKLHLSKKAKSTYLKPNERLLVFYENPAYEALKRSSTGILLSLILSLTVVLSLFYLLKIIRKQKELAEIKNDLISNITHEFKTPIATVSTAIEAIESFNVIDDKEKTKKYLSMSSIQLKKLHLMVEKLLETATLDSENLLLKKEEVNLIELIEKAVNKHKIIDTEKQIRFSSNVNTLGMYLDSFHIENAVSNLIENALKYGGNCIDVNINSILNQTEITVADNGNGIDKNQQEKIFDKFYRVPKGNTHDVKGFGIGLYYTKKIVEKHQGIISLFSEKQKTVFKITLPNGS
ncbi:MAG: HAMP domain-containing histidine kinase [Flavobacteriaceae bacterium]